MSDSLKQLGRVLRGERRPRQIVIDLRPLKEAILHPEVELFLEKTLASLPPREVLITQILIGMKSPITGFVNTLSGVLRKFVYAVAAIKKAKEGAAATESAPKSA